MSLAAAGLAVLATASAHGGTVTVSEVAPPSQVPSSFTGVTVYYGNHSGDGIQEISINGAPATLFGHRVYTTGPAYEFGLQWASQTSGASTLSFDTRDDAGKPYWSYYALSSNVANPLGQTPFGPDNLYLKITANQGMSIALSGLMINGQSLGESLSFTGAKRDDVKIWKLEGVGGASFEGMTGSFTFGYASGVGRQVDRPMFQIYLTDPTTKRIQDPPPDDQDVQAVPLPAAAWMGLGLLSSLAAAAKGRSLLERKQD